VSDTEQQEEIEYQQAQQARGEQVEQAMRESGQRDSTPVQDDYFAFDQTERIVLPDEVSYVDVRVLNEGARRKYLNELNKEVRLQKATGDAVMKLASGDERRSILEESVVGWNLTRNGNPVEFNRGNLRTFLDKANPRVIDVIYERVRKINPWLTQEVTVEEIDNQIAELEQLREEKLKEEEGKAI
jgi:hypothetical protein